MFGGVGAVAGLDRSWADGEGLGLVGDGVVVVEGAGLSGVLG